MSKKMVKILTTLVMVIMIVTVAISSFALSPGEIQANTTVNGTTEIQTVGESIVGILQTVGVVLSVIVLIVLGRVIVCKADSVKALLPINSHLESVSVHGITRSERG